MQQSRATEFYDRIRQIAPDITQKITSAANKAHNEAEFERDLNNIIKKVADDMGVELLFRQQYTLATGRADAVYNRFVIEYEPPNSLRANLSHGHTNHAVQQVKDYIVGLAKAERHDRDRLLGVAFDGRYYIFVRYHEGHFITEDPLAVTPASTERFLRSLFSLSSGRALIPENLVEDFGSQNIMAHQVTRALYNALEGREDDLTAKLFAQWQLFFGETAGYDAAEGKLKHKKELSAFARGMGLRQSTMDVPRFFFAIHTYFSFLVKNTARLVLQAYAGGAFGTTPLTTIANLQGESLRRELGKMENGDIFRTLGLKNLLEGDFFSWYLSAWDSDIEDALQQVLGRLAEYNPVTVQDDPYSARDLLKKLYHYLLPREIRHDLGEFYTPDWLAERLLNQLQEPLFRMPRPGDKPTRPGKRLLDPACGSGTFLILAIRALKANCQLAGLAEADTLHIILDSVAGIDLNPLAVMAARVNVLLAIADLLPYRRSEIEIPVYLADSILTPSRGKGLFDHHKRILETAVGPLAVPNVIDSRAEIEKLTDVLDEYVRASFSTEAFLQRCRQELPDVAVDPESTPILRELFEYLNDLHQRGLDGIWARVLKNAFMPLFLEPFDYIAGNPPWINWNNLPQGYRDSIGPLWLEYNLFLHKGFDAILGKASDDLSTLMTYIVTDKYLKDKGKLAFVITQSVWKSSGGGKGFRQFKIGTSGPSLQILHVDDLSNVQIFEGASTRTSVFVLTKNAETRYPVPYTYWKKISKGNSLDYDSTLEEVMAQTKRLMFQAIPVDANDKTSAWLTARSKSVSSIRDVIGKSPYRARIGIKASINGIFWLEKLTTRPDGLLVVRNLAERSKKNVESITVDIEPDLIFPLIQGREVKKWYVSSEAFILVTHLPGQRLKAIEVGDMQKVWPRTFSYLSRFQTILENSGVIGRYFPNGPFYSMFNIGDYTFAKYKLVFREISSDFTCAVITNPDNGKVAIPDHKLVMCSCKTLDEAHYLCALLNSSIARYIVASFVIGTQHSTHIFEHLQIPQWNAKNGTHVKLANLSASAHDLAKKIYMGNGEAKKGLKQIEVQVDEAAAELWGLNIEELFDVQTSLKELKG
ncbi:MAG: N-6 DNA methylase [Anaerolineales bacterium]|nr:N-6 DNA methylase [Anaerolineales bacterium]